MLGNIEKSIVAANGMHIVTQLPPGLDHPVPVVVYASTNGGNTYQLTKSVGLPDEVFDSGPALVPFHGGFLAFHSDTVYVSTDGLNWQPRRVRA